MEYMDNEYKAIKKELLKNEIAKTVADSIDCLNLNLDLVANTQAIAILDEVRNVLLNEKSDLQVASKIRKIFDDHKISYEKTMQEKFCESLFQKNS